MVDFGGMVDKAKDWAGDNPEKADEYVDKGSDTVKGRLEGHDEQVDQFGGRAKDFLHDAPDEQPQGETPPPPAPEG